MLDVYHEGVYNFYLTTGRMTQRRIRWWIAIKGLKWRCLERGVEV
jgi:hypothetical protein